MATAQSARAAAMYCPAKRPRGLKRAHRQATSVDGAITWWTDSGMAGVAKGLRRDWFMMRGRRCRRGRGACPALLRRGKDEEVRIRRWDGRTEGEREREAGSQPRAGGRRTSRPRPNELPLRPHHLSNLTITTHRRQSPCSAASSTSQSTPSSSPCSWPESSVTPVSRRRSERCLTRM